MEKTIRGVSAGLIFLLLLLPITLSAGAAEGIPRIGFLRAGVPPDPYVEAFRRGLRELGYIEGKTIVIEYRSGEGGYARHAEIADEFLRLKVDVIMAGGTTAATAIKKATNTIPIVMVMGADPVAAGFANSLARPGGNATGFLQFSVELTAKQLELLKETVPSLARLGVLYAEQSEANALQLKELERVASSLRLTPVPISVREPAGLDAAFAAVTQARFEALFVLSGTMFIGQRQRIANLAANSGVPSIFGNVDHVEAGGLMAYGVGVEDLYRRAARYVDRILKGAKPGDLPFEQATRFELVINLKTAKQIGFTFPESVLVRADRLID
jgi:putative tryptophan/tyrosine transport system substrate-binding protein